MRKGLKNRLLILAIMFSLLISGMFSLFLDPIEAQAATTYTPSLSAGTPSGGKVVLSAGMSKSDSNQQCYYAYQWQISSNNGSSWSNISGATGSTYTVNMGSYNSNYRWRCNISVYEPEYYNVIKDAYRIFLEREGEPAGVNDWWNRLVNHTITQDMKNDATLCRTNCAGSFDFDVKNEAAAIALAMLISEEYSNRYSSHVPDDWMENGNANHFDHRHTIIACYQFLLGRTPSEAEINSQISTLNNDQGMHKRSAGGGTYLLWLQYPGYWELVNRITKSAEWNNGASIKSRYHNKYSEPNFTFGSTGDQTYWSGSASTTKSTSAWAIPYKSVTLTKGSYISAVSGAGSYYPGQSVTVTATPTTATTQYSYGFVNWTGSGVSSSTNRSYTFTMPNGNVSLTANGSRTVNSYTQKTQVRYQNTDGSWPSTYTVVDTKNVAYGSSYSWSTSSISGFNTSAFDSKSVASYSVTGAKTNSVDITRKKYTQTVNYRYQNIDGTYPDTYETDTSDVYYGATYSWSKAATDVYSSASVSGYTVDAAKSTSVDIPRRTYNQRVRIRFENADGTFTDWEDALNADYRYGETILWSRDADEVYQSASIETYDVTEDKSQDVSIYRQLYMQTVNIRYENADGSFTDWETVIDTNYRYGAEVSYSRAADEVYKAASVSYVVSSDNTGDDTVELSIYRQKYRQTVKVKYENADGSFTDWTYPIDDDYRYGEEISWNLPTSQVYVGNSIETYLVTEDKEQEVAVYRRQYRQRIIAFYQKIDNEFEDEGEVVLDDYYRYGEIISWTRPRDEVFESGNVLAYSVTQDRDNKPLIYRRVYPVEFLDVVGNEDGIVLKKDIKIFLYGQTADASVWGTDTDENIYYTNYKLNNYTSVEVTEDGLKVYRFFDFVYDDISATYNGNPVMVGGEYNKEDITVHVKLYDGSERDLSVEEWEVDNLFVSSKGENLHRATWQGKDALFFVPGIVDCALFADYTGDPVKVGTSYDKDDVSVTLRMYDINGDVYSSDVSLDSDEWEEDSLNVSQMGDNDFTATYNDDYIVGNSVSAGFTVEGYKDADFLSAEYKGDPVYVTSCYDKDDVEVVLHYDDDSYDVIPSDLWTADNLSVSNDGTNDFVATYDGLDAPFTVEGYKVISFISAEYNGDPVSIDHNYNKDDVTVTVFYDDDTNKVLTSDEWTENSLHVSNVGENDYTASYKDFECVYDVEGYSSKKGLICSYNGGHVLVGQEYDKDDVSVSVLYNDGTTIPLSSDEWEESGLLVEVNGENPFSAVYESLIGSYEVTGYKQIKDIRAKYTGNSVKVENYYDKDDVEIIVTYHDGEEYRLDSSEYSVNSLKVCVRGDNDFVAFYKDYEIPFVVPGYDDIVSFSAKYVGPSIIVGQEYNKADVRCTLIYESGDRETFSPDDGVDLKNIESGSKSSVKTDIELEEESLDGLPVLEIGGAYGDEMLTEEVNDASIISNIDWTESSLKVTKLGENTYLASYLGLSAIYTVPGIKEGDKIVSISAQYNGMPLYVGDMYDKNKVLVTAHYSSGFKRLLNTNDWKSNGYIVKKVGDNEYDVYYNDMTADFRISGLDRPLETAVDNTPKQAEATPSVSSEEPKSNDSTVVITTVEETTPKIEQPSLITVRNQKEVVQTGDASFIDVLVVLLLFLTGIEGIYIIRYMIKQHNDC